MKTIVAIFEQLIPISGGGTPRTSHIVRSLVRREHQVYVAASFGVSSDKARRKMGCAGVLKLPHVSRLDRRKMLKYLFVYPWNILRLAFYVWRVKPDVVVSHNSVAGFGALLGQWLSPHTVTILDLTDLLFEYLESYSSRWIGWALAIGRALECYTLRRSDLVLTISEAMCTILGTDYLVDRNRIEIVHDGVDCELFRPQNCHGLRQEVTPWARHICILHGVIDPQDAPSTLVEASPLVLSRLPDTAFWWVGDGTAVPGLKARVDELGLGKHFFFSGWMTQEHVVRYINASDLGIVVLPDVLSARGRVTLKEFEYWACGKAAVLPRLPALQEIVADEQASLFFAPGDAQDLADAICTLLDDDPRRATMGRRGRQTVMERFDWRVLADRLVSISEEYVSALQAVAGANGTSGGAA